MTLSLVTIKKLLILQIHFSEFQISEFALYLTMYTNEKN